MKKFFLCLLMSLIGMFYSVEAQTIAFEDGFESGDFSTKYGDWIQEAVVGNTAWQIESAGPDLEYPSTVLFGNRRAYLRNTTGETQGYVTRLITPVMRLDTVYQPMLSFWYANPKWTADRDTLRVLYKDAPKADWKLLREFSTAQANWQKVEMTLPMYSEAYQIAFEGKDNLGHGIVLDSVIVRSTPECTVPHDVIVNNLGAGLVNIAWTASWDANKFEVIVTKYVIDPDTISKIPADQLAFHDSTKTGLQQNIDAQLVSGEYYYVFVRSICDGENSAWNNPKGYYFRVKATKNVPYYYDCNMPYEPGVARRDLEWTWRNDLPSTAQSTFVPFINVGVEPKDLGKYSKDATTAICFNGYPFKIETPFPADRYCYVASPALADTLNPNFALNQCQVRFWSTVYIYTGNYAHSIIVGAMVDPEDFNSFVPVDTISVWGTSTFQENIVDFSSYQGDGNYIAFVSNFDTQNIIFIDDIYVEYRNDVQKPTNISVNPRGTKADITWQSTASTFNLVITNEEVDPAKATTAQIVVRENGITGHSYHCEALEADHSWNRPYFVYVQAVGADTVSAWSYRYPFVTIAAERALPYTFDFEQSSGIYTIGDDATMYPTNIGIFSNDPEYPHEVVSNAYKGSSCMFLTKDPGNDSWFTLPPVDSLKGTQVKFYLSGSSTPAQASAIVGVMTNPMDINTFIPVSECKIASTGYTLCYANFQNYDGPDGIIAIKWGEVNGKQTINYIDELTVEEIAKCLPPVNITIDATSDSAAVSWDKSDANTWEFIFSKSTLTDKQLSELSLDSISHMENTIFADTLTWDQPQNNPTFGFDSLTYNNTYYIYVRTMCGEEKTWWVSSSFKTPCPDDFPLPFYEDFEGVPTGDYSAGFKCWQFANYATGTGYPKILNLTTGQPNGNMLELWSTSTSQRNLAMLPGLDADIKKVVLSFKTRSWGPTAKSVIYVGSMADINDWASFVAVDTFYNENGNLTQVRMDLANYNFAYNNIVFTSGLGDNLEMASDVMIDDISIKPNTCIEAWNFEATDIQDKTIDIKWEGKSTDDEWKVKVMKDTIVVIPDTTVIGKAFHAEGLEAVTKYTFYVKPVCDTIWSSESYYTACIKLDPTKPNKETFEEYPSGTSYNVSYQAPCWTVGNGNPSASTTYIPYIYKTSSTYAASGTNCYRLYPTATYSPTWVAAPEVDCNSLTELLVTFSFYGGTSYYILPGVMTDPEDLTTFVVLDSIKGQGKIATISMDLSDYADQIPATAKYVAWRTAYNAGPTIYLDDISIVKMNCPLPKPSYSALQAEQVRISSGLRTDNEWILLMTDTLPKGVSAETLSLINVDSLVHNDSIWKAHVVYYDTIDARNQMVTGLTEQTEYYVAVATVCEDGISQWQLISFKTPCLAVTPEAMGTITFSKDQGYVTGSGKELPCWTTSNKSNTSSTSYIPYVGTTTSYMHNGNNYLYIYSYVPSSSTSANYDGAYAIMPELNVKDISKYQVNFWARTTSSTGVAYRDQMIVGIVTDPSDLNTFVAIDTLKLSKSAYEPFTISFEDYQGDYMGNKGRYIMFLTETGSTPGTLAYGYAYVSEISVENIPTCRPVTEFKVDSVAEDMAMISWKQYSDSYRMMMSDEEVAEKDKATYDKWLIDSVLTKTDSVLIEGLKPNSHYYVYAQALCDGGDSSAISMAYAHILTDCPYVKGFDVPYFTDFDHNSATGTGKRPDCWEGVQLAFDTVGTTQSYPYVYSLKASSVSEPYVLYMYSYGYWNNTSKMFTTNAKSIAVAPKVKGNLAEYMVSFYAKKTGTTDSYGEKLLLGYVTDATQKGMDSTFVKITDVEVTTTTQSPYQVILGDYVTSLPEGARLALKADWTKQGFDTTALTANKSFYAYFYLDNFKIGMPPSCFPPKLEPGNTSLNTADVNIVPAKAWNDKWQIAVVPDSIYSKAGYDAAGHLASDTVRIVDADSANFVISGLTPGTQYWLYARTVCGGEDGNSAWTDLAVSTRTKYYFKDGYYFGFEKSEGWEFCQNSTSTTYWVNPAIEVGYEGGSATTSYTSYYPYCMANTTSSVYAYGPREASDPKNAALRWQASSSYWGGYAVFPGVDEAHDRSFEFKVRCGYGSYNSTKDTIGISTNYACDIEVGMIDKNKGFETYQVLSTVNLPVIPKVKGGLTAANDWFWTQITLDLDSTTVANKQMVLRMPKPADTNTRYIHFDDVTLGAPKGYGLVAISMVEPEATKANVSWDDLGGPWNLYITKENGKKTDTIASYLNLTATSQEVTGLTPQTTYTAVLVAVNAPLDTKFKVKDSKEFRTPCLPLEADANGEFFWDFNDPNETEPNDLLAGAAADTAYLKPSCFTTGTTYTGSWSNGYQWLWQSKGHDYITTLGNPSDTYNHREIGYGDSFGSLRVYTTSTYTSATVKTWIALPELKCDFDTMMIEFWGRCLANQDETAPSNAGKVLSTTYLGATYSKSLVIGTLTDPHDFSTLEVIDTITYAVPSGITTSTLVSGDPTGNRYWQKFQVPLAGTSGKYIVLFQPAYGLFFVDNLKITSVGDNLFAPKNAQTGTVTTNSATFNWIAQHPTIQTVVVVTDQAGTTEVLRDTIEGSQMTFTVDTLKPATGYQWYVYQTNGTVNTLTSGNKAFYTECVAVTPEYKTGFELMDGWKILPAQTSDTYKQTLCWVYENAGTAAIGTNEYNYANTSTIQYSHKGAYALRLYASGTTIQTYAAMPAIEDIAAYDTLQVNFWMRPGYHNPTTGKISTQYTLGTSASTKEYYYAKSVIVGTMTDPMDPTTFVPIDTLTYNGTLATTDVVNEANDYLFQPKKVALAGATGKYVTFMATLWAKGAVNKSTNDYVWIDDISFSPIQRCEAPNEMTATNIGAATATLSWKAPEGADKYILQVSSDYTFAEDTAYVFNDTVYTNTHVVTGMKEFTDYIWRVRTICGEDLGESEFSMNSTFTTARKPFFVETFAAANLDADWNFATNPALLVIDSADVELNGANNTSYGWRRVTSGSGISGAHYAAVFYSSSSTTTTDYDYYWMISPTITLNETDDALLSFDMALTGCSASTTPGTTPATEAQMADDYTFLIVISDDGGKTWKKENVVGIWNNTLPAGSQLRDIPFNPADFRIDLKKYAGKNIRIGFYREADTYKGSSPYTCAVHLDNIRINYYGMREDNAEACQYQDINKLGFFINGDIAQVGDTTLRRIDKAVDFDAKTKGDKDSIFVLNVKYNEAVTVVFEDTICEGETYSNHDFSGKTTSGLYKRKLQGVNHCDSLACLKLYVIPRKETSLEATICQGDVYVHPTHDAFQWKIDREGVYHDTLTSVETGCDSVLTLALHVQQPQTSEFSAKACETTGYYWEAAGKTYTESGDFTEKLASIYGCDSTVTLHLTIAKLYQDSKTAEIKEGESYTFYGETFTKSGTYQVVVPGQDGECDSTHVLVLNVQTGLENVADGNLMLMPNVIHAGESVTATGDFKGTVHVEVYDIVGRMILSEDQRATNKRISISAFDNSGVYTVRISDKLNTQFVGRVIVQ